LKIVGSEAPGVVKCESYGNFEGMEKNYSASRFQIPSLLAYLP